ncbi:IS21 family transposase, partial [Elizabethkingia argentiflava]|nr:IS21 family transposase [Elizabethkingia argenteiflava]
MANKLDPMDLKQIIQLHLDGYSNRNIGLTLGISRNTVNHYMKLFKASDYPMEALLSFDQNHLRSQFPAYTTIDNKRYDELVGFPFLVRFKIRQFFILYPIYFLLIYNSKFLFFLFSVFHRR